MLFQDFDRDAAWPGLSNVRSRTMVVYAELDAIPESFARAFAEAIPGANFQFLPVNSPIGVTVGF
jgi:hypothetical protein